MPQKRTTTRRKAANTSAQANPVPVDWQAAPRAAQALRLRRMGYTYAEIAERCGYKEESGARKAIKKASQNIIQDEARELVQWQADALEEAIRLVRERIRRDDQYSLFAVDRLAPLLKRHSELFGIDAPKPDSQNAQQMTLVAIEAPLMEAI